MKIERVESFSRYRTPEFRRCSEVIALCERRPYVWLWRDPPARPAGHFGTFFGARTEKVYGNPYIGDLYEYHEHTHDDTMRRSKTYSYDEWVSAVIDSELIASVTSECFVYLRIPGLRTKTFRHRIWVDRFLESATFMKKHRQAAELFIGADRLRAVQKPKFDDIFENQLRNYYDQNFTWCRIWAEPVGYGRHAATPAFRAVERHMADPRWTAKEHLEWLRSVSGANPFGGGPIPFLNQALAFEQVYRATNEKYGNGLFLR